MVILESGAIKIDDNLLDRMGETYTQCAYVKEQYSTFEKFVKTMIAVITKKG